jgi:tight adherence protein B
VQPISGSAKSFSAHWASGGTELYQQILLAALGSTILFGLALVWTLRGERRKAVIEPRLKAISMATSSAKSVVVSVRRPLPQRRALPAALLARLDSALAATGGRIGIPHLVVTAILADAVISFVAAVTHTPPGLTIVLIGAALVGAPAILLQLSQSRNQRQFLDIFPDALDLIVRAVRGGLPVLEAIQLAAHEIRPPVAVEFERMLGEIRIGVEMEDALQHAADRIRVPDFRFFVVSLLLQRRTGGSIAETLSNLSAIIRQRKALRMKARALTAEAMASTVVVAIMPFVAGVGLFLIDRQVLAILFIDPRGRFMLGVAMVSLLFGIIVMKVMISKSLR